MFELDMLNIGNFFVLIMIKVSGIEDFKEEIFGFVLYVVIFKVNELDKVIVVINVIGYGLIFGL